MRAIQITEYVKSPLSLTVSTLPTPHPSQTSYLIAIHATATNFFDTLQIQNKYQHQPPLPWISGSEFSGVILSCPTSPSPTPSTEDNTQGFKPGDMVFGAAQGAYSTHICCPASQIRHIPPGWSFADAAGLMITAPTSYYALRHRSSLGPTSSVLIHAAAGGVGLAAVQVAKAAGALVIATAGSDRKMEVARSYGADYCLDYRKEGWEEEVRKLTGGGGVDVVFDPVGMVNKSLKCVARGGKILVIGFAAGEIEKVAMNRVLLKNVDLVGVHWGVIAREEKEVEESVWSGLEALMKRGVFKGTRFTDKTFVGLESVGRALECLGGRETWGKVVVEVEQERESKL